MMTGNKQPVIASTCEAISPIVGAGDCFASARNDKGWIPFNLKMP